MMTIAQLLTGSIVVLPMFYSAHVLTLAEVALSCLFGIAVGACWRE